MQLTIGEYAISKEAPLLRVWPKTCPVGTETGRRADACQLSLGEQLALGVPVVTKEWHKRTWNCCFFQVRISSQRPPLVCSAARGSSVMGGLLPELLYEKEPVSACIRGC